MSPFTPEDAINGLNHCADDHPCCRAFLDAVSELVAQLSHQPDNPSNAEETLAQVEAQFRASERQQIIGLLREIMDAHKDLNDPNYNFCDYVEGDKLRSGPCMWCLKAEAMIRSPILSPQPETNHKEGK